MGGHRPWYSSGWFPCEVNPPSDFFYSLCSGGSIAYPKLSSVCFSASASCDSLASFMLCGTPTIAQACLKAFEPLFLKYNVDLYFAGHQHHYERLWPLGAGALQLSRFSTIRDSFARFSVLISVLFANYSSIYRAELQLASPGDKVVQKNYDNPPVPVYIVNGAAGNVEGHQVNTTALFGFCLFVTFVLRSDFLRFLCALERVLKRLVLCAAGSGREGAYRAAQHQGLRSENHRFDFVNVVLTLRAVFSGARAGFGTLEVVNSTNVNWKFFRSADGALLDQITIRKQH